MMKKKKKKEGDCKAMLFCAVNALAVGLIFLAAAAAAALHSLKLVCTALLFHSFIFLHNMLQVRQTGCPVRRQRNSRKNAERSKRERKEKDLKSKGKLKEYKRDGEVTLTNSVELN